MAALVGTKDVGLIIVMKLVVITKLAATGKIQVVKEVLDVLLIQIMVVVMMQQKVAGGIMEIIAKSFIAQVGLTQMKQLA